MDSARLSGGDHRLGHGQLVLYTPYHTLTVTEPANLVQIILFFVISAAVAVVVDIAERRRAIANRRLQAVVLSDLARGALDEGDDIRSLLARLRETFNLERVDLHSSIRRNARSGSRWQPPIRVASVCRGLVKGTVACRWQVMACALSSTGAI
ncbi:DUF4118 domain-containing protein [Corynebacterium jeikeium]|uniref:DUF4118 domain-containing protein n=1 Tax=Corynebacterium jeikeium TaxID=38289 RepID=UPI002868A513|nr:DUF4118 domain-containing protein [Corynebacterium jeikeium]